MTEVEEKGARGKERDGGKGRRQARGRKRKRERREGEGRAQGRERRGEFLGVKYVFTLSLDIKYLAFVAAVVNQGF